VPFILVMNAAGGNQVSPDRTGAAASRSLPPPRRWP